MPPEPIQSQGRIPLNRDSSSSNFRPALVGNDDNNAPWSYNRYQGSLNRPRNNGLNTIDESDGDNSRMARDSNSTMTARNQSNNRDPRSVRFNENQRNHGAARNNEKNSIRNPQQGIGLRARTHQLEIDHQTNAGRQRSVGKGDSFQTADASSAPSAPSNTARGKDQSFNQNEAGFGRRSGGYGGMNGGGYGGMGGGYGGFGGGMYGMGGMGMGMGMGSHMMMGPLSWIYSLNSIVHSIPMIMDVIGMNSQMLYQLFTQTCALLMKIVNIVKRSDFRRFLQQKSRRSKVLRMIFVISAMGLASQAVRLAKLIVQHQFNQRGRLLNV